MLDLESFAAKIRERRESLQIALEQFSDQTGIPADRVRRLESAQVEPSGDEVLIFADFYRTDYRYFISNEPERSFQRLEILFRRHGEELSPGDRWAINEFLFLCDNEQFLLEALERPVVSAFQFTKTGTYHKAHGESAAAQLRDHLRCASDQVHVNVFDDFRRIGIHMFRRRLESSEVSGLFIRHERAGKCVLVNYEEDFYRQRFTASHEAAHAILDEDEEFILSSRWKKGDLVEIRANTFAAHYLVPSSVIDLLRSVDEWTPEKIIDVASKLRVSVSMIANRLSESGLIDEASRNRLSEHRVPLRQKTDPELSGHMSPRTRERKQRLLELGVSDYYVGLCLDAYDGGLVSQSRIAEMLLVSPDELGEVVAMFGRRLGE